MSLITKFCLGLALFGALNLSASEHPKECLSSVMGLPFEVPSALLTSLVDDKLYFPAAFQNSPIPRWTRSYLHGGKRLRPLFVYLSALAMGKTAKQVEPLAGLVELIHLGSLALDDIIDGAVQRRNSDCLHVGEGMVAGLITPMWLQANVFCTAENVTHSAVRSEMAEVLMGMGNGEIIQSQLKVRQKTGGTYTREEYENVAMGKTGFLFGFAFSMGPSHFKANPKLITKWRALGQTLGVAYQIKDDFEDAVNEPTEINYALLLASMRYGGSAFRQLTPEQLAEMLAERRPEIEFKKRAAHALLEGIKSDVISPLSEDQEAAFSTLRAMINYVFTS